MPVENVYQNIASILQRIESIKRRFGVMPPNVSETPNTGFSDELSKKTAAIDEPDTHEEPPGQAKKTDGRYEDIVRTAARRFGLPEELIMAVIRQESGFDSTAVSSKGAMGLMQLMPETARVLGVENPFNPEENIFGGTRYLVDLINQYDGNLNLALAAYNAGPNRVDNEVPEITETEDFIDSVLKRYQSYQKLNKEEL